MAQFDELFEKVMGINEDGEVVTESVVYPSAVLKSKLKRIKKHKPSEDSNSEEIQEFVDKYYDSLVKAATVLEKEPEKIKLEDFRIVVGTIVAFVTGLATAFLSAPTGIFIILFSLVYPLIQKVLYKYRAINDKTAFNNFLKIKASLKKIQEKDLSDSYLDKIKDLIEKIDDIEKEFVDVTIVHKESVEEIKLNIYESCHSGEITEEERDNLLNIID